MDANHILELKITLLDTKPTVHRTIQIEPNRTFFDLHVAIQIAFNWTNSHLHSFEVDSEEIGMKDIENEFGDEDEILDEQIITLGEKIQTLKQKFFYIYDFGDNWEHKIELVKLVESKNSFYPRCVRGANNTPPDDCGGVGGFQIFKEAMGDKKHPEHKEFKKWYGRLFDEEYFSLSEINEEFKEFDEIKKTMLEDMEDF